MTDPHLPPDPTDDELVSAVLDDEATPDERARVEADPSLRARLERFRQVRAAVATPVVPPAGTDRDALIATALAGRPVGDRQHPTGHASDTSDPRGQTVPLARARRRPRPLTIAAAAAVAVLLPLAALVALRSDDEPAEQYAAVGSAVDESTTLAPSEEPAADRNEPQTATAEAFSAQPDSAAGDDAALADLGPVDDPAELADTTTRYQRSLATAPSTTLPGAPGSTTTTTVGTDGGAAVAPTGASTTTCEDAIRARTPGLGPVSLVAGLTYQGTPAWVYVVESSGTGGPTAFAVAKDDCRELARTTL